MKNNFKFLIVLAILLAGCICVGSTFAADITVDDVDDASLIVSNVDDTENIEIAHDSSQNVVDLNNNDTNEDSDKVNTNTVSNHKAVNSKSDIKTINALSSSNPKSNIPMLGAGNYVWTTGEYFTQMSFEFNISSLEVYPGEKIHIVCKSLGTMSSLSCYVELKIGNAGLCSFSVGLGKTWQGDITIPNTVSLGEQVLSASIKLEGTTSPVTGSTTMKVKQYPTFEGLSFGSTVYPGNPSVTVALGNSGHDFNGGNVVITLNKDKTFSGTLGTDGKVIINTFGLSPGTVYTVTNVQYAGDNTHFGTTFAPASDNSFTYSKATPSSGSAKIDNSTLSYGKDLFVSGSVSGVSGGAIPTGNVTIILSNGDSKTVDLSSGKFSTSFSNLGIGTYTIRSAMYNGDGNYNSFNLTCSGSCLIYNPVPGCNVTVPDYVVNGSSAHIVVNISGNGPVPTGKVNVTVGSDTYNDLSLSNGIVEFDTKPLTENSSVSVSYSGDSCYEPKVFNNVAFINVKYHSGINYTSIVPVYYEDSLTVKVTVSSDEFNIAPTGKVNVTLSNGKTLNATLSDGKATLVFEMLDAGDYNITSICYEGDDNYLPCNCSPNDPFTILPKVINISVDIPEYEYGANIAGSFNYTDHEGNVSITIDDTVYNSTFDNDGDFVFNKVLPVKEYTGAFAFITNDGNYVGNDIVVFNVVNSTKGSFNVKVKDIVYGDSFIINVTDAIGVLGEKLNGTVSVIINSKEYNFTVTDGSGFKVVSDVLPVGEYSVSASLTALNYAVIGNNTGFNVTNATGSFKISVGDITYGDSFIINVTDAIGVNDEQLNGTVVVTINNKDYMVVISNGSGSKVVSDVLPVDSYPVSASLTVPNYNVITNSCSFSVNKADCSFVISVVDVPYYGGFTVNVTATGVLGEGLNGTIRFVVNGTSYSFTVTDGEGYKHFDTILPVEEYDVVANFTTPVNYNVAYNSTSFNVIPANGSFVITVDDIVYGNAFIIEVVDAKGMFGENLTGLLNVTVNGEDYEVRIVNGKGSLIVGDILPVDEYPVDASLIIPNYNPIINNTAFNVTNATGSFVISIENITYDDSFTINVTDAIGVNDEHLNGTVIVTIDGNDYEVIISNGSGFLVVSDVLDAGSYPVNASLTVPNYFVIENSTTLNILPANGSKVNVSIDSSYDSNMTGKLNVTGHPGIVSINVNGVVYNGTVDENGDFIIFGSDKLDPGNYSDVNFTYISDDGDFVADKLVNITVKPGNLTKLDIKIRGSFNSPLSGNIGVVGHPGNIVVVIEGVSYSGRVDENGDFTISGVEDLPAGDYNDVNLSYVSDDGKYNGSSLVNFTIEKINVTLDVGPIKGNVGDKVKVTVKVTDQNGNPVKDGVVTIELDGKNYTGIVKDGVAIVEVVLPSAGTYTANVYYDGENTNYNNASVEVEVVSVDNSRAGDLGGIPMEATGNPLLVLLIALCAIGLESFRRKF